MMKIVEVEKITDEIYAAFQSLIPQLTTSGEIPERNELDSIAAADATRLFIAVDDAKEPEKIVGVLALIIYRIPTGHVARIEDVVVEEDERRQGVGRLLIETAIQHAKRAEVKAVDLTSNPARIAANELYRKMGFKKRNTNLYRYTYPLHDD
jgi:ribosomal protein S18 acetylase RimI-like enzyme